MVEVTRNGGKALSGGGAGQGFIRDQSRRGERRAEAMRAQRSAAALREGEFKKLLEDAKNAPVEKPVRDVDLD